MRRIIWAVDPFDHANSQAASIKLLQHFKKNLGAEIEPVFVLSPSGPVFKRDFNDMAFYRKKAIHKFDVMMRRKDTQGFKEPKIIIQKSSFLRKSCKALLSHARNRKASSIVVNSHARKGALRMVLGSFAETLVFQSNIPVMVVNPNHKVGPKLGRILFPTDFSGASKRSFKHVLKLAKAFKAEVVIHHLYEGDPDNLSKKLYKHLNAPIDPTAYKFQVGGIGGLSKLDAWLSEARRYRVKTKVSIDTGLKANSDSIVKAASKEKAKLIAMVGHTDSFAAAIVGSTSRWVIRKAPCPVWVLHLTA